MAFGAELERNLEREDVECHWDLGRRMMGEISSHGAVEVKRAEPLLSSQIQAYIMPRLLENFGKAFILFVHSHRTKHFQVTPHVLQ